MFLSPQLERARIDCLQAKAAQTVAEAQVGMGKAGKRGGNVGEFGVTTKTFSRVRIVDGECLSHPNDMTASPPQCMFQVISLSSERTKLLGENRWLREEVRRLVARSIRERICVYIVMRGILDDDDGRRRGWGKGECVHDEFVRPS